MHLGLIGFPLSHSWSPEWYRKKFDSTGITGEYNLYAIPSIHEFPGLIQNNPQLDGLNVTIPYKSLVIPFLDELDPVAAAIGAVNTIRIRKNGSSVHLKGFNTDAPGFEMTLKELPANVQALILGTGGASKAVAYVMQKMGIKFQFVSRNQNTPEILNYQLLNAKIIENHKLIINATPVGMFPDIESCPLFPWQYVTSQHLFYDLIYNPETTKFLRLAAEKGAYTRNGMEMLKNQAGISFDLFQKQVPL